MTQSIQHPQKHRLPHLRLGPLAFHQIECEGQTLQIISLPFVLSNSGLLYSSATMMFDCNNTIHTSTSPREHRNFEVL
jgi:hypothetical protein